MRVKLSIEEVNYLLREKFLPERLIALVQNVERLGPSSIILEISNEQADELRDAFGNRMQEIGFGEDYEPTPEGRILESLIDRFLAA